MSISTHSLLDHPAYLMAVKISGYNTTGSRITVFQAVTDTDAAKVLIKAFPEWSNQDHLRLQEEHRTEAQRHCDAWNKVADEAAQATFGRPFHVTDYRISAIGSDEFSPEHKQALRLHAHAKGKHQRLASAHGIAAHSRRVRPTSEAA